MHDHVAGAQLGHQRRVAVEHLHVARLRGQLDRRRRVIEEDALGRDQPDAELIGFVCHISLRDSCQCQLTAISRTARSTVAIVS